MIVLGRTLVCLVVCSLYYSSLISLLVSTENILQKDVNIPPPSFV